MSSAVARAGAALATAAGRAGTLGAERATVLRGAVLRPADTGTSALLADAGAIAGGVGAAAAVARADLVGLVGWAGGAAFFGVWGVWLVSVAPAALTGRAALRAADGLDCAATGATGICTTGALALTGALRRLDSTAVLATGGVALVALVAVGAVGARLAFFACFATGVLGARVIASAWGAESAGIGVLRRDLEGVAIGRVSVEAPPGMLGRLARGGGGKASG
jgi:hypothetical protein